MSENKLVIKVSIKIDRAVWKKLRRLKEYLASIVKLRKKAGLTEAQFRMLIDEINSARLDAK